MHYEFSYYPVTAGAIRAAAERTLGRSQAVRRLMDDVQAEHRGAVEAVEGDLEHGIQLALDPPTAAMLEADRTALWAVAQLEYFADAVDAYNVTSVNPRSIRALNSAQRLAMADVTGAPDNSEYNATLGQLRREYMTLEANLDDAAAQVAANLSAAPTDSQIQQAWSDGNLPAEARLTWPQLHLRMVDLTVPPADIQNLPDEDLAQFILDNPGMPEAMLQWIQENRADVMELVAENWTLEPEGNSGPLGYGSVFELPCVNTNQGYIVGPDGLTYQVQIPGPLEVDGPVITGPNNMIQDEGWTSVAMGVADVAAGEPIDFGDTVAYILVATANVDPFFSDAHSVGREHSSYMVFDPYGGATLNDGTRPNATIPEIPEDAQIPDPASSSVGDVTAGALDLALSGLEGINDAQLAENDRHHAVQVVFQTNEDGERRAVIIIRQVRSDGDEVFIESGYGGFDHQGNLVGVERPEEDDD
jgi:hypothetical protein